MGQAIETYGDLRRQMGRPHTILGRERLRGARWPGSGCTEVQSGEEILGTRCQDDGLRAIAMALEVFVDVSAPGLGDCSILADDQVVTQAIRNQDRSAAHYTLKEIIYPLGPRTCRRQGGEITDKAAKEGKMPSADQQILATALKRQWMREHRSVGQATRRL
ncbi:hypothetical protein KXV68_000996, partial [Aspergillus fumigatus]